MSQPRPTRGSPSGVIKLKDVAQLAGCSIATASRVLNGQKTVGAAERAKVERAAAQLGYVPNTAARALRSQRTRLVGVIIPTLEHAIYARMVDALQQRLEKARMSVIISCSGYDLQREHEQAKVMVARGVDAVVMVGTEHIDETTDYLRMAGVRQVFTYTNEFGAGDAAVGFDNRAAARTAAEYLLNLGHRRFAMISGVTHGNDRARQRRDTFLETLRDKASIDPRDVIVTEAPYNIDLGRAAMQSIMQTHPRPTAVFCGSDVLAIGAIRYCDAAGISVPGDVSVMGFDNLEIADLIKPGLTTLDVPVQAMGEGAADALLGADAKRTGVIVDLPVRLVVRTSTAPAPEEQ